MEAMLDFTSNETDITNLITHSIFLLLIWISLLSLTKQTFKHLASIFWSHPIPISTAFIPSKLPHPNPPGGAIPFDISLLKATKDDVEKFMKFMQRDKLLSVGHWNILQQDEKWTTQDVADCAAVYKGRLYEERAMKWIDDHFRLKRPNLKYPYVDRHWNGWSSFWLETGPHIQSMFLSSITVTVEHIINGLILPMGYLYSQNLLYYNLALYSEVAYMIYASVLIGLSYRLKRDVTIEQMHPAVWPLLLLHHVSSLVLCIGCLLLGDSVPRHLVCYAFLCLLGFTSSLHYIGQILDFSPWAQANRPFTRLTHHIFCLVSQVMFRAVYWIKICYLSVEHCIEVHGLGLASVLVLILLLFTAFNFDFVRFHLKATKGCWLRIQQTKVS